MSIDWILLPSSDLQTILRVAIDRNAKKKRAERVRKVLNVRLECPAPESFSRARDPLPLSGIAWREGGSWGNILEISGDWRTFVTYPVFEANATGD